MIYLVQTLKQVEDQMLNTDFVIEANDESDIKTIMNISKVIVLWSTIVPWWPKSGEFFVDLEYQDKRLRCCIAADSIEHACERCIIMDLPVIRLHSKTSQISESISNDIIQKYKTYYSEQKRLKIEQAKEEKIKKEQSIDNKKQKKIAEIITQTLQDINNISPEIKKNPIFASDIKKLNENSEILTKMKMGSNTEKASSVLEQTLAIMEKIEIESINSMKKQEEVVLDTSVVSNVDVVGELEKLKRSKQVSDVGINKNKSDIYYTFFGIAWLYQKFIAKDIINKLLKFQELLSWLIWYMNFWIIWVSILIGIRAIFKNSQNIILSKETYKYIIMLGLLWLLWNIPTIFKNKKAIFIILSIIVAIWLLILIQQLLIINLALI